MLDLLKKNNPNLSFKIFDDNCIEVSHNESTYAIIIDESMELTFVEPSNDTEKDSDVHGSMLNAMKEIHKYISYNLDSIMTFYEEDGAGDSDEFREEYNNATRELYEEFVDEVNHINKQ